MIMAAIVAVLVAGGVYLVMQRGMLRLIMGLTLLGHGVNLLILATGVGAWRSDPLMNQTNPADAADPLPQAFVLTAIVISMASTAVMLAMAALGRDDDTQSTEDLETASRRLRPFQTMANHQPAEPQVKKLGENPYCEVHSAADEDRAAHRADHKADQKENDH